MYPLPAPGMAHEAKSKVKGEGEVDMALTAAKGLTNAQEHLTICPLRLLTDCLYNCHAKPAGMRYFSPSASNLWNRPLTVFTLLLIRSNSSGLPSAVSLIAAKPWPGSLPAVSIAARKVSTCLQGAGEAAESNCGRRAEGKLTCARRCVEQRIRE